MTRLKLLLEKVKPILYRSKSFSISFLVFLSHESDVTKAPRTEATKEYTTGSQPIDEIQVRAECWGERDMAQQKYNDCVLLTLCM